MIENFVAVTNIEYAGLVHTLIRKMQDAGKETPEARKAEIQRNLENTTIVQPVPQISDSQGEIIDPRYGGDMKVLKGRKKVLLIYNSKGKVVEYDKYGRHLDIKA